MMRFTMFHLAVVTTSLWTTALAADTKTPHGYVRASTLVDASIRDADGDEHAKIVDVLLCPTHDQVRYAVVRCEDRDDVDFLVPVETLKFSVDDDGDVVLGAQRATLVRMRSTPRDGTASSTRDDAEAGDPHAEKRHVGESGALATTHAKDCRVRDLLGKDVTDAAGDKLGTIDDLLISQTTGAVPLAVVATGGVLGLGETSHVVPPTAIRSTTTADGESRLTLATTKELLANAPKCDEDSCPDPSQDGLLARLDELFTSPSSLRDDSIVHASTIVGSDVRVMGQSGDVGEVKDVTFDPVDGRLAFVVLDLDELPGTDDCTVAVPWQAASYDAAAERLTIDADAKRLAAAECRLKEGTKDLEDSSVCERVTRWFGFESTPVTTVGSSNAVGANQLLDRDVRDSTGTDVGEIEDVAVETASGQLRYVAVLLDRGNDKLVALKWNELSIPKEKNDVTLLLAAPQLRSDRSLRPNGRTGERRDG